jgi:hypothetical protein
VAFELKVGQASACPVFRAAKRIKTSHSDRSEKKFGLNVVPNGATHKTLEISAKTLDLFRIRGILP